MTGGHGDRRPPMTYAEHNRNFKLTLFLIVAVAVAIAVWELIAEFA